MALGFPVGGLQYSEELGTGISASMTYCVPITKSSEPNPILAALIARNDANVPQYNAPMYSGMDMYCYSRVVSIDDSSTGKDVWNVFITCQFRPGHLVGRNFVAFFTPCMDMRTTSHSFNGTLLSVPYTDPVTSVTTYQAGSIEILYPGGEITCRGIVSTADPVGLQGQWQGYCNATEWLGFAPYTVLCTGATPEPISLSETPPRYWFTFTFKLKNPLPGSMMLGWDTELEWLNEDGNLPDDAEPLNGLLHILPYPDMDYNVTAPLGTESA